MKWQNTRFPLDKQTFNKISKELKYLLEEDQSSKNKCLMQNLTATSSTDCYLWKISKSIKKAIIFETPLRKPDHSWARNSVEKASLFASHLENVLVEKYTHLLTKKSTVSPHF